MNLVRADYLRFITHGELGPLRVGAPWSSVVAALGEPPLYEPPRGQTPAFARYGDLDFTIASGRVSVISLRIRDQRPELPRALVLANFEDPALSLGEVERLLDRSGVTWTRFEPLCDEWIDYYQTSAGVHLSFGGGHLGVVGVARHATQPPRAVSGDFVLRGQFQPSGAERDHESLFWQSPTPAQAVDKFEWRPCHACAAMIPVVFDHRIVRPDRTVEPTGTLSYVCPHCRATQVGTAPDPELFDPQRSCHVCAHELGDSLACPGCGMPRYWTLVRCPRCAARQAVLAPHLANSCDLYTLACVACEQQYVSLCIC